MKPPKTSPHKNPQEKNFQKVRKKMLEKTHNNHMYTTDVPDETENINDHDEFILEIIENEEKELQEKIDDYYRGE